MLNSNSADRRLWSFNDLKNNSCIKSNQLTTSCSLFSVRCQRHVTIKPRIYVIRYYTYTRGTIKHKRDIIQTINNPRFQKWWRVLETNVSACLFTLPRKQSKAENFLFIQVHICLRFNVTLPCKFLFGLSHSLLTLSSSSNESHEYK